MNAIPWRDLSIRGRHFVASLIVLALLAELILGVPKPVQANMDPALAPQDPLISVNQTGYFPGAPKHAVIVSDSRTPLDWRLVDGQGSVLLEGQTTPFGDDAASGESVHLIDFSALTTPGTGYLLQVGESKQRAV